MKEQQRQFTCEKLLLLCDDAFMCPQKRDVSSEDKEKFPYDIVKMALPPEAQLAADAEVRSHRSIVIDDLSPQLS